MTTDTLQSRSVKSVYTDPGSKFHQFSRQGQHLSVTTPWLLLLLFCSPRDVDFGTLNQLFIAFFNK